MGEHTPGPWGDERKSVIVRGLTWVAHAHYPTKEGEANARLIAAAPELLEGAQDAVEAFKILRVGMLDNKAALEVKDAHIDELNYAIAKATGNG